MGGLKLPHQVGEEILQDIGVLVKLQETLSMFGGGWYSLQPVFLIRTCDGFVILVVRIFDQRTS